MLSRINNNFRVVVVGLGAVTSLGDRKDLFWKNLINNKSGIRRVRLDKCGISYVNLGKVKKIKQPIHSRKESFEAMSRCSQMMISAVSEAIIDSQIRAGDLKSQDLGIFAGTTSSELENIEKINDKFILNNLGSLMPNDYIKAFPTSLLGNIWDYFNFEGPAKIFRTACASGNYAIAEGFDMIRSGKLKQAIVGASDAICRVPLCGFKQLRSIAKDKCMPFDKNRSGLILGEGAGILVLEELNSAIMRKANIYAEVLGYGLSCDAYHVTSPSYKGILKCMKNALYNSNIKISQIDFICTHGTGTYQNDRNEAKAIRKLFGNKIKDVFLSSIKSSLGHALGAASAIEAVATVLSVKKDIIPPTLNYLNFDLECGVKNIYNHPIKKEIRIAFNNSFAFGGNNCTLVIGKYERLRNVNFKD